MLAQRHDRMFPWTLLMTMLSQRSKLIGRQQLHMHDQWLQMGVQGLRFESIIQGAGTQSAGLVTGCGLKLVL